MREEQPRAEGAGPDPGDDPSSLHFAGRHEVWGDDPEEIAASRVVEEFAGDEEIQRRWHDHAAFAPIKVVVRFIRESGTRIAVSVAGFTVLALGVAMLVLPGPGLVLILVGLGKTETVIEIKVINGTALSGSSGSRHWTFVCKKVTPSTFVQTKVEGID